MERLTGGAAAVVIDHPKALANPNMFSKNCAFFPLHFDTRFQFTVKISIIYN
jgi:hypothetical protein